MSENESGSVAVNESLTFDEVSKLFNLPIAEAANILGVCSSVLKKICRENGVIRWPYRKYLSGKTVEEIKKDAAREKNRELAELSRAAARQRMDGLATSLSSTLSSVHQGVFMPAHAFQQQGNKLFQNGRNLMPYHLTATRGYPAYVDEFRYGFPSDGLSSASIKWWGNNSSDDTELVLEEKLTTEEVNKQNPSELPNDSGQCTMVTEERPDRKTENSDTGIQGASLLLSVRKRAAEEGIETLKLGVSKGWASKLGKREKLLHLQVFKSTLPS